MGKWGAIRTGSVSHTGRKKIIKLGNDEMGCELEEWGCASEIKQNLNKIKAAPCEMQEKRQAVVARRAGGKWGKYQTTNFAQVSNLGKVCATKSDISEDSEGNGEVRKRGERNFGEKRV